MIKAFAVIVIIAMMSNNCFAQRSNVPKDYKGTPYEDSRYKKGAQVIPGRVQCAYYDMGGEGVTYHDADAKNHGSGELNPADGSYLNEFRIHEGVDISYTKFHRTPEPFDDNRYEKLTPPAEQLYVGWTEPGEWFRITVNVRRAGLYSADLLSTSKPRRSDLRGCEWEGCYRTVGDRIDIQRG